MKIGQLAISLSSIILLANSCILSAERPNILFIFADDWGFGDLSMRGHEVIETPHIDQLAKDGADFQQFTVASGVCSPSRAALLTGQFPSRYLIEQHFAHIRHHIRAGMPDWLDPQAPMLPRQLQKAGYATYHFGKWHVTSRNITDAPHPTAYGYNESAIWNGPDPSIDPHEIFDLTIKVIEASKDQPFFINLWLNETHTPHFPTKQWLDYYAAKGLGERERVYPAVVSFADEQIGRILGALEKAGIEDKTLVIFTSDNGPEYPLEQKSRMMDHPEIGKGLNTWYSLGSSGGLRGAKRSLHEGGIRVPLVVRWPEKVQANSVDKTSVITAVDWLPTLCKLANAPIPEAYDGDGEDRSNVLLGKPSERSRPIFWRWNVARGNGDMWAYAAIRFGKWKLLTSRNQQRIELYDIPADHAEANDLSSEHPEVTELLTALLTNWLADLPKEPNPNCFSKLRQN